MTGKTDAEYVADIIDELGGKAMRDPRNLAHQTTPLVQYAYSEIQRIIDRLRSPPPLPLTVPRYSTDNPARAGSVPYRHPSHADLRKVQKMLRRFPQTPSVVDVRKYRLEPPWRTDPLKYQCAKEALYLLGCYSPKAPTGTHEGAFHTVARLIHNAVTGSAEKESMRNACNLAQGHSKPRD